MAEQKTSEQVQEQLKQTFLEWLTTVPGRLKNYALWLALIAFIPVAAQSFGYNVLPDNYDSLATGILGILVLLGLVNNPSSGSGLVDKIE